VGQLGDENPAWFGDYALDFNYEAPFYSAFAANHVELTDAYDKPVIRLAAAGAESRDGASFTGASTELHIGPPPNAAPTPMNGT